VTEVADGSGYVLKALTFCTPMKEDSKTRQITIGCSRVNSRSQCIVAIMHNKELFAQQLLYTPQTITSTLAECK